MKAELNIINTPVTIEFAYSLHGLHIFVSRYESTAIDKHVTECNFIDLFLFKF
jgi:hypothetical protein